MEAGSFESPVQETFLQNILLSSNMSKTHIQLNCGVCSKSFWYINGEYNRQTKKGRTTFFCSLSCASTFRLKNRTSEEVLRNIKRLQKFNTGRPGKKKGKFTYILRKARNRKFKDGLPFDSCNTFSELTEEYLQSIWTERCSLSNVPITLQKNGEKMGLTSASLDRIDSSKGYIQGNVQFVAYGINLAKNNFSDADVISFLDSIHTSRFKSNSA